jgi:hypothetical protein
MTFEDIDYILAHQKKVKLPDRRWLHIWNSYDIQNFRCINEDADEYEKNRNEIIKRGVEIREAANAGLPTADLEFFQQHLQQQRNIQEVLQQQQNNFDALDQAMRNGMRGDVEVMLNTLAQSVQDQRRRDRIAQEVLQKHVDVAAEDRKMMREALGRLGVGLERQAEATDRRQQ